MRTVRSNIVISNPSLSHSHLSAHFLRLSELFVFSEETFLSLYRGVRWVFLLSVPIPSVTVLLPQGPCSLLFLPVLCQ